MSMMAAAGALAANALTAGRSAEKFDPPMALAFRFTVKIGSLDLGGWESCSGLRVEFKPFEVKGGGNYLTRRYLPGEVSYKNITLKRAVVAKQSKVLQKWLADQAEKWISGGAVSAATATIAMFDSYGDEVMTWTLSNVRPAAWSGPELNAKDSKVGVETLELVHEGFTVKTGGSTFGSLVPAPKDARRPDIAGTAKPTLSEGGKKVEFPFPPQDMSVKRTSETVGITINTEGNATQGTKTDVTQFELKGLHLESPDVRATVQTLTEWASLTKAAKQQKQTSYQPLPAIDFTWGKLKTKVQISSLSVSYKRFLSDGTPVRATVTVTLDEQAQPPAKGGRNPTSGGPPGRAAHVMTTADTLPALARSHLGSAGQWRTLAASNDIDDPLRIRPGSRVYLPPPAGDEMPAGVVA